MNVKRTLAASAAFLTLAAYASLASSCVVRQYPAAKRSVTVQGTGSVAVEADRALIQLSVITSAKEAGQAAALNAERMTKVQEAIIAAGASKDAISTENYSIYQESDYVNNRRVMGDYRVSNDIKVYLKDKSLVSTIIDEAIKAGANSLSSLTFSVSNPELAIKEARTSAVRNAQEAAKLIAGTAGSELGKVLEVHEVTGNYSARKVLSNAMFEAAALTADGAETPVSSGKINFDVTVDATFELK